MYEILLNEEYLKFYKLSDTFTCKNLIESINVCLPRKQPFLFILPEYVKHWQGTAYCRECQERVSILGTIF